MSKSIGFIKYSMVYSIGLLNMLSKFELKITNSLVFSVELRDQWIWFGGFKNQICQAHTGNLLKPFTPGCED